MCYSNWWMIYLQLEMKSSVSHLMFPRPSRRQAADVLTLACGGACVSSRLSFHITNNVATCWRLCCFFYHFSASGCNMCIRWLSDPDIFWMFLRSVVISSRCVTTLNKSQNTEIDSIAEDLSCVSLKTPVCPVRRWAPVFVSHFLFFSPLPHHLLVDVISSTVPLPPSSCGGFSVFFPLQINAPRLCRFPPVHPEALITFGILKSLVLGLDGGFSVEMCASFSRLDFTARVRLCFLSIIYHLARRRCSACSLENGWNGSV